MKTATVQELHDPSSEVLDWVRAGEEVAISEGGVVIARLAPEKPAPVTPAEPAENPLTRYVDWTTSAAFQRDKSKMKMLTAEESAAIIKEASGNW